MLSQFEETVGHGRGSDGVRTALRPDPVMIASYPCETSRFSARRPEVLVVQCRMRSINKLDKESSETRRHAGGTRPSRLGRFPAPMPVKNLLLPPEETAPACMASPR